MCAVERALSSWLHKRMADSPSNHPPDIQESAMSITREEHASSTKQQKLRCSFRSPPPDEKTPCRKLLERPGRVRSHSRVSVDYFDPAGVRRITRTISQQPPDEDSRPSNSEKDARNSSPADSDTALIGEGPFDFEKALQHYLKKYIHSLLFLSSLIISS